MAILGKALAKDLDQRYGAARLMERDLRALLSRMGNEPVEHDVADFAGTLLKGTKVDGVYSADPKVHKDAERFQQLSHQDVLARDLKVADATAISLARDNALDMVFFNLDQPGNIARAVSGETIGTRVHADHPTPRQGEL